MAIDQRLATDGDERLQAIVGGTGACGCRTAASTMAVCRIMNRSCWIAGAPASQSSVGRLGAAPAACMRHGQRALTSNFCAGRRNRQSYLKRDASSPPSPNTGRHIVHERTRIGGATDAQACGQRWPPCARHEREIARLVIARVRREMPDRIVLIAPSTASSRWNSTSLAPLASR